MHDMTEEDFNTVIKLLSEYSRLLRASVELRYQSRRRRSFAVIGIVALLLLGLAGIVVLLLALNGAFGGKNAPLTAILAPAFCTLSALLLAFPVAAMIIDESKRVATTGQDIDVLARKLERAIGYASALDEHKIQSFARRLELDLQLTAAEAILIDAGFTEQQRDPDRIPR